MQESVIDKNEIKLEAGFAIPIGRQLAGLHNPATGQVILAVPDVPLDLTRLMTGPSSDAFFVCNEAAPSMAVG